MKYQFFSISAHAPEAAQTELNRFCASHRVASVEKQFVANGAASYAKPYLSRLACQRMRYLPMRNWQRWCVAGLPIGLA